MSKQENQTSVFESDFPKTVVVKIFDFFASIPDAVKVNRENIKGKKIIAIYQYEKGHTAKNRAWDKCLIEVESGFVITEKVIAPKGTGYAGIWIFSSKAAMVDQIGKGFRQIA
ncbi:MAG: hypothetical protein AB8G15_04985 [Saprospiraceae bacterium]